MAVTARLEVQRVSKTFRASRLSIKALEGISLQVMPREFLTIVGPSGSGKSTLFNLIAGLMEPDEGAILIDGLPSSGRLGQFGYMPQRDLLLPWRSVIENVILPQEVRGAALPEARRRAIELLPLFGLESFGNAYPAELSGGMRQRAALLRTVLSDRDILLLDEPFGALDALTRRELQDWLLGLWQHFRQTVVFITHDVEEAIYLGDRVIVISPRPGRVLSTLQVSLPRPRRQGMIARPEFGALATQLLESLGVQV
jgi:ABC-type nitrate/sulfonate/bicarbonate transport system ATPase subunit